MASLLRHRFLWLSVSISVPFYFGLITLQYALSHDYMVQDDARQHVVWFQQWINPQLFQQDWIAHYFQTIAPIGYKSLYWVMAKLGVEPVLLAKLLPTLLALVATIYLFQACLIIFPISFSAFLSTLIFNQQIWLNDDLVSSTPRAFVYPLFAAFLYYLLRRLLIPCLIAITLQGLFFPQMMLVEVAVLTLRLVEWRGRSLKLTPHRMHYRIWLAGVGVALIALIPFMLGVSEFGAVITADQMRALPEYGWRGRNEYFGVNPLNFILNGASGLRIPVFPSIIWLGFGLPLVLKSRLPLIDLVKKEVRILYQILLGSLGLFLVAHLLLLRLHFPSRYTYHSWRFVLSIAAGMVLTILLHAGWYWLQQKRRLKVQLRIRERLSIGCVAIFSIVVVVVPAIPPLFWQFQGWVVGDAPELYAYLLNQPEKTVVASLSPEANNIPAFAQRSTLVGREFALGHHPDYYRQIHQRTIDLIRAQYSPNPLDIQHAIDRYGIDFFLIDRTAFSVSYLEQDWLIYSSMNSVVQDVITQREQGITPAMIKWIDQCSVLSIKNLILVEAACTQSAHSSR